MTHADLRLIPTIERRFQRAVFGSLLTGALGQLVLLFSGSIIARRLGADGRGQLALLALAPSVVAQLGTLGMPGAVTYYVSRDPQSARAIIRRIVLPAVLQMLFLAALDVGVGKLLFAGEPHRVKIAAFAVTVVIPGMVLLQYSLAILQGQRRFGAFNVLRVTTGVVYAAAAGLFAVLNRGSILLFGCAWAVSYLVVGILVTFYVVRGLADSDPSRPCASRRELATFGIKALFGGTSVVESFRMDQWIVGLFLTRASLGVYVIAGAFSTLPNLLANSFGFVLFPYVASQARGSGGTRAMWRFVAVGIGGSAAVVGVLELTVGWLLPLCFGPGFAIAVPAARLLLIGAFFLAAKRVLSDGLRGLGRPIPGTIAEVFLWVALVVATIPLLPLFGLEGVAAAVSVATAVSFAVLLAAAVDRLDVRRSLARANSVVRVLPRAAVIPLIACGAGAALPFVATSGGHALDYGVAAAVIIISAYPIMVRVIRGTFDIFEPVVIACLTLGIAFGARPIAMILMSDYTFYGQVDLTPNISSTLWLVLGATTAFVVGYEVVSARPLRRQPLLPAAMNRDLLRGYLVLLGVLGTLLYFFYLLQTGSPLGTIRMNLQGRSKALYSLDTSSTAYLTNAPILLSCVSILYVITTRGRMSIWKRFGVALVILMPFTLDLSTGSRRFLIPTVVLPVLVYYLRERRRPSLLQFVVIVPLAFLLLAGLPSFRTASARQQSGGLGSAIVQHVTSPAGTAKKFLVGNDNEMFSALVSEVGVLKGPDDFSYGGATLGNMLLAPIPHIVFPGKPENENDRLLTKIFGAPCQAVGGVCPDFSIVGSFYHDGWWIAVVVGMTLLGAASAGIWRRYTSKPDIQSTLLAAVFTVFLPIVIRAGFWPGFAWFLFFYIPCAAGLAIAGARARRMPKARTVGEPA